MKKKDREDVGIKAVYMLILGGITVRGDSEEL